MFRVRVTIVKFLYLVPLIMKMISIIKYYSMDLPMQPYSLTIAKLKLYIRYGVIVIFGLFVCTFFWLVNSCRGSGKSGCQLTWLHGILLSKKIESMGEVLWMAVYRVASLLSSGGVGDVKPHTTTERLLATAFMLLGFFGSGYLQALVTSHIRTVANEKDIHTTKLTQFISCLKANGVKFVIENTTHCVC